MTSTLNLNEPSFLDQVAFDSLNRNLSSSGSPICAMDVFGLCVSLFDLLAFKNKVLDMAASWISLQHARAQIK
jgi:hypothetical protein